MEIWASIEKSFSIEQNQLNIGYHTLHLLSRFRNLMDDMKQEGKEISKEEIASY